MDTVNDRKKQKDYAFLAMADEAASMSHDPSTKVGAVLLDDSGVVISTGYNGFPRGFHNDNRWHDKDSKYRLVMHAELNALLFAGRSATGGTLYCTHPPCQECAKAIAQVGIKRLVCWKPARAFSHRWGLHHCEHVLREARITTIQYKREPT